MKIYSIYNFKHKNSTLILRLSTKFRFFQTSNSRYVKKLYKFRQRAKNHRTSGYQTNSRHYPVKHRSYLMHPEEHVLVRKRRGKMEEKRVRRKDKSRKPVSPFHSRTWTITFSANQNGNETNVRFQTLVGIIQERERKRETRQFVGNFCASGRKIRWEMWLAAGLRRMQASSCKRQMSKRETFGDRSTERGVEEEGNGRGNLGRNKAVITLVPRLTGPLVKSWIIVLIHCEWTRVPLQME